MDIVDLLLAILHHFLVFTLAGMLAAEFVLVRPGLSGASLGVLGRIDGAYGGVAMAIIVVGICRVLFGLKGWEYYVYEPCVLGQDGGLRGRRPAVDPADHAHHRLAQGSGDRRRARRPRSAAVRSWIKGEVFFLALVLVFAAAMARGIGY